MAGGKETPRQKMVGMMYLVLTALLALQVSNTVLEKFIFINQSLERQVGEYSVKNKEKVDAIKKAVGDAGNRGEDVKVMNHAEEVRKATSELLAYMTATKEEIIEVTGGKDENGHMLGAKDEENMANLMINQGKANEMQKKLNDYAAYLAKSTGDTFSPLALDGKDNPVFKDDPNQNTKDFAHLTFEMSPAAAGLASISQLETEVLAYEARALEDLARKVGAEDVKFDKVIPMVLPESKIVAAGAKYQAEMFIAASSSGITPTMKYDGKDIPVTDGKGKVEFTATPGTYDADGYAKKTFKAEITVKLPGGRDTTYTNNIEYFVTKPVIQIQSASVSALYLNCGNELNVQVPALGAAYDPSFQTTGGTNEKGAKKGLVTIVPNSKEVKLSVYNGGNLLGTETFKVRPIPKPEITVTAGGKPVNEKMGESITKLRRLEIKAVPDEGFASFLPKDAQYRVTEAEVTLARGSRPVAGPMKVTNEVADLSSFQGPAKPGDRIVVEIKDVKRRNYKGSVENVNMGVQIKQIPLN
ncbi:gliding motility protein GldM [Cytophagales bacterium LB-30]|uniref:Gliding motility protein GldM n=1 Tax=Shiella aurantiaca TaxID=3058365 RepID=A0ABT8F6Y4_9BACT|nr:gliding motility protein GldM [Shiella aurantiaca]MDN4166148.1 gliding motility protein GldM [Shiella aurantiaca]